MRCNEQVKKMSKCSGNYAPSPDNVVIAAPHRRTDIHRHAHGDTEYPTNEEKKKPRLMVTLHFQRPFQLYTFQIDRFG